MQKNDLKYVCGLTALLRLSSWIKWAYF